MRKVWDTQVVSSVALDVVTTDHRKDDDDAPKRYEQLGVQELVVFDWFRGPDRPSA